MSEALVEKIVRRSLRARPGKGGSMKLVWKAYHKVKVNGEYIYLVEKAYASNSDGNIILEEIVEDTFNKAVARKEEVNICAYEDAQMNVRRKIDKLNREDVLNG